MPDPCWPPALFLLVHAVAASSRSLLFLESARLILTHALAPTLFPSRLFIFQITPPGSPP